MITCNKEKMPRPRSGAAVCCLNEKLYMFGGTNVAHKFSDFWFFENGEWTEIE